MSYLCGFEFEGNNFIYNNIVKYIAKRIYL